MSPSVSYDRLAPISREDQDFASLMFKGRDLLQFRFSKSLTQVNCTFLNRNAFTTSETELKLIEPQLKNKHHAAIASGIILTMASSTSLVTPTSWDLLNIPMRLVVF